MQKFFNENFKLPFLMYKQHCAFVNQTAVCIITSKLLDGFNLACNHENAIAFLAVDYLLFNNHDFAWFFCLFEPLSIICKWIYTMLFLHILWCGNGSKEFEGYSEILAAKCGLYWQHLVRQSYFCLVFTAWKVTHNKF